MAEHPRPAAPRGRARSAKNCRFSRTQWDQGMITVVAAVIEREDRRLLIGQRRRTDSSPLKWEFPGGKVKAGETPVQALTRELREELDVTLHRAVPISYVEHEYGGGMGTLSITFFAVEIRESQLRPGPFEQVAWV